MARIATANTFAYGRTYESRRRYSCLLSVIIQVAVELHQLPGHRIEAEALGRCARRLAHRPAGADRTVRFLQQPGDARHVVGLADPAIHARLEHLGGAAARAEIGRAHV